MYIALRPLVGPLVLGLAMLVGCSAGTTTPHVPFASATSSLTAGAALTTPRLSAPSAAWSHTYARPALRTPELSYSVPATPQQPIAASIVAPSRDLRIMTFNLRVSTLFDGSNTWGLRKGMVLERIRSFDPDILGTQEGLNSQTKFLQSNLGEYTFFGAGRSDGERGGEMCGVFFKSAKFEQIDGGHFWLSTQPEKPGSKGWGGFFPRMVTWVKLRPRDGGQTFCWFNTHFDAWKARARVESAKLLQQRMISIAGGLPCIVTGDFNTGEGSTPYQTLCSTRAGYGVQLTDAFRAVNRRIEDEGTRHGFDGDKDGERIDWILVSPQFQPISAAIDHTRGLLGYPSDHFPVTAIVRPLANYGTPLASID